MSGFKLLSIRALDNCSDKYLKILKPNIFYTFYKNYSFSEDANTKNITVEYSSDFSEEIYEIRGHSSTVDVNVCAIVGKNGSGKSTLLELYYLCMYFIAVNRDRPFLEPNLKSIKRDLEKLDKGKKDDKSKRLYLESLREEIQDIIAGFKIQLFYSVDDTIYLYDTSGGSEKELEYDFVRLLEGNKKEKRKFLISSLFEEDSPYDPIGFAYTCVINYSIFGLNSLELGQWVTTLFHKNDAYKTPIVINPMRTNGDFVIDDENELLTGRILQSLAICLKNDQLKDIGSLLGTYRRPESVIFRLKKSIGINGLTPKNDGSRELLFFDKSIYTDGEKDFLRFKKHLKEILNVDVEEVIKNNLLQRYCMSYSYSKALRIFNNYPVFRGKKRDKDFLILLWTDRSHITLKFRQSINFIIDSRFEKLKNAFFIDINTDIDLLEIKKEDYKVEVEYSLPEIKSEFETAEDELASVPPPIFEIDFQFSESKKDRLNLLSSGESQSAHAMNAIYYHLRNIDSMNKAQLGFDYKYVNIILDEVELYHHPEIQRTFLQRLLNGIEALRLKK